MMTNSFGRDDYKGWEMVACWAPGPGYTLEWNIRQGDRTHGAFESRAAAEAWIDSRLT